MTVVIMALIRDKNGRVQLAACADRLLSGGGYSLDMGMGSKISRLLPQTSDPDSCDAKWLFGFAGDPANFLAIRDRVSATITAQSSGEEVVEAIREAFGVRRRDVFEQRVLSPFGLSVSEFLANGRALFGDDEFARLCGALAEFQFDCELVLGGWSTDGVRLVTFHNPGLVMDHFVEGVAAIGEGATLALGHLWSTYDRFLGTLRALYRVLEAKFIAEATRSVGRETSLFVMDDSAGIQTVTKDDCAKFRGLWEPFRMNVPLPLANEIRITPVRWLDPDSPGAVVAAEHEPPAPS